MNGDTEKLGVYYKNNNSFDVVINDSVYNVSKTINNSLWHNLYINFDNTGTNIYIDGNPLLTTALTVYLGGATTYLGSTTKESTVSLNGYLQLFAFSNYRYISQTSHAIPSTTKIIKNKDSLGRDDSKDVYSNNLHLHKNYTYQFGRLVQETMYDGRIKEYTYSLVGNNLISIKTYNGNVLEDEHYYSYDSYNRLDSESFGGSLYRYSYDNNGNIISKKKYINDQLVSNDVFEYHQGYKTRLEKYNEKEIKYENPEAYYPTSIDGNTLVWDVKRLKSYGNISFEYNEFGQRTKKINGTSVTEYIYDGNSLIRMIDPSGNIYDFIYDENRYLEGFIYNFSNVYYYERDITGNIEKIIDNNGSTVVQYKYDAWGKFLENAISSGAPQCNPYLYKGYCYDEET